MASNSEQLLEPNIPSHASPATCEEHLFAFHGLDHLTCVEVHDRLHDVMDERNQLAKDVLWLAAIGGMPESYWESDQHVLRACRVLGWTPEQAIEWVQAR